MASATPPSASGGPVLPPLAEEGGSDGDTVVLDGASGGLGLMPLGAAAQARQAKAGPRSVGSRAMASKKLGSEMGAAEAERIGLVRKIEVARLRVDELDKQVYDRKEAVRKLSDALGSHWVGVKKIGRAKASEEHQMIVRRAQAKLETQKSELAVRRNRVVSQNNVLRSDVDTMRRERMVFEQLFAQMEAELARKKQTVQEQSTLIEAAYHARDQAQLEMNELRTEMERTQAEIDTEWAMLDRVIGQSGEDGSPVPEMILGDMTIEEEQKLRQDVKSGAASLHRDKQAVVDARQRLQVRPGALRRRGDRVRLTHTRMRVRGAPQAYENTWAEIQHRTGVDKFETMVKNFSEFEDQVRGPS